MFKKLFKWIRWLFILVWLLFLVTLSWWITFENSTPAQLNLFGINLPESTLGVYLCWTLVAGVLLGWAGTWLLSRVKLFARQRELRKMRKEMARLRISQQHATAPPASEPRSAGLLE